MIESNKTMIRLGLAVFAAIGIAAAVTWGGGVATAGQASAGELSETAAIARGGRLYSKWFKVIGADRPTKTHPAYPSDGQAKKDATWRCQECHGWDYLGKDGAYAEGPNFTDISGINGKAGADPAAVVAILKDETHALADEMDDEDFEDLALFITRGQVDMDTYIDRETKAPKGDKAAGKVYFETVCIGCHSAKGTRPKDMQKTLGGLMDDPWSVMHNIMNGVPDEKMPALRAFDLQVAADIMAHLTTLPKE